MKRSILSLFIFLIGLVVLTGCDTTTPNTPTFDDTTPITNNIKLTKDYASKSFITDGIGEVSLSRFVDGDTTIFKTKTDGDFTVRYQGIDTPESTFRIDPWGFAASNFTKAAIKDAIANNCKIVLECEDMSIRTDSNGRYLAWVWIVNPADNTSKLLNMELSELGYAYAKADGTQFSSNFIEAIKRVSNARKRIYGETDPNYDYSKKGKEISIKAIHEQYGTAEKVEAAMKNDTVNSSAGTAVIVNGIVVRKNGNSNAYIQQYDSETNKYYGVYVYGGYNSISKLEIGYSVQISAKIGYYFGSLQITDVRNDNLIKVYSFNQIDATKIEDVDPSTLSINDYTTIGNLVRVKDLKVTGYKDATQGGHAFTLITKFTDKSGVEHRLDVRVDGNIELFDPSNTLITSGAYFNGKTIKSVVAIVGYYNGNQNSTSYSDGYIQLLFTDMADIELV